MTIESRPNQPRDDYLDASDIFGNQARPPMKEAQAILAFHEPHLNTPLFNVFATNGLGSTINFIAVEFPDGTAHIVSSKKENPFLAADEGTRKALSDKYPIVKYVKLKSVDFIDGMVQVELVENDKPMYSEISMNQPQAFLHALSEGYQAIILQHQIRKGGEL